MTAKTKTHNNNSTHSPALPDQSLRLSEFKEWIKNAETAPSISLNDAKTIWKTKRKMLRNLTRKKLVMEERERYLAGLGKSYSWEEVKDMAINKKRP